ncbi:uncharacterized protein B0P05DRAFT_575546 [Gilbertella persicaria]|uniref:uncharacterized protein n=1 Tax=Gilbertella persicaria TaxID=101096 RepID=UPI00221FBDF9|nr:uncharacterized protein B0P05DRAFT_575546 [Gilbertella persicaria]KAI8052560.1 hypothetical protein B0P05DRAFT_575546 [Gilbertella persicaria]
MKPCLRKSILLVILLLQCSTIVYSQQVSSNDAQPSNPTTTEAQVTTTQAQITTTVTATTTQAPQITTTTTQAEQQTTSEKPVAITTTTMDPVTTTKATTDAAQTTDSTATDNDKTPLTTIAGGTTISRTTERNRPSATDNVSSISASSMTPTSQADKQEDDGSNNKTAVIAGSVVGCLVGVAAIGGLLTWMNRRGGCTSRTRRRDRPTDFVGEEGFKMTENTVDPHSLGSPASPFEQHARRFVPPTSGYMNLNDEEYGYHQTINTASYPQDHQEYYTQPDYTAQNYYPSTVTTPTLINTPIVPANGNYQSFKPDQIEQKPNAA